MNFKHSMIVFIFCIIYATNCIKDFSDISTGFATLSHAEGFDFSHNRIISFRQVDELSFDEKSNSMDLIV